MESQSNTLHIHVSNISEDVWDFIDTLTPEKKAFEIAENAELSDRDLFYFTHTPDLILLVPKRIDPDFFVYFSSLFPKNHVQVLWPEKSAGELSRDILTDEKLMATLHSLIRKYSQVEITSYSSTRQFFGLFGALTTRHNNITGPETPEKQSWAVDFYGSKMGIRQSQFTYSGDELFPMCDGKITFGTRSAACLAAVYYEKYDGVVLKTNKGHAGMGVMIIKKGELSKVDNYKHSGVTHSYRFPHWVQIEEKLTEKYWSAFPIVVEQFIYCDHTVGGGFPNAEAFIDREGVTHYLYSCGMRVTDEGEFKGVEIGKEAVSAGVEKKLQEFGKTLGALYAEAGYVGYFDIDCLYGKDKKLYLSESNVRRTGGTHVYLTAKALFGKDFINETYALSNNTYQIKDKKERTFKELHNVLIPVLFDPRTKEGVFIVAANLLHRAVFGYIIFGKDRKRAHEIEAEMERLLISTSHDG